MTRLTPLLVALAFCASCKLPQPDKGPHSEPLWESLLITTAESYEHAESGTVFPTKVAGFELKRVVQYDEEGYDIAVGYECRIPKGTIIVTLYLYPNEGGTVKEAMERSTAGILRANPGSEIHSERVSMLIPDEQGSQITVISPRTTAFGNTAFISEAHVFVLDNTWLLKVRSSYTMYLWDDAKAELKRFMSELKLPAQRAK